MDAYHDQMTATRLAALEERDERLRLMGATPDCPYCGTSDGMAGYIPATALWNLAQMDGEYDRYPFYRLTSADDKLRQPCGYCNRNWRVPLEYKRLTWRQAWLHARRQARLENRQTKGERS